MRIISQDGMIDMPYEQMVINISYKDKKQIVASGANCEAESSIFPIAKYSTEEKAQKAMEMLRKAFSNYDWIKTTGDSDELKKSASMLTYEEFSKMVSAHFKFPTDEEIEV